MAEDPLGDGSDFGVTGDWWGYDAPDLRPTRHLNVTPFGERLVLYCRRNGNRIIYSLLGFVGLCVAAIALRWA